MGLDTKMLVSDYDQTFYISDEDIEKNKTEVNKFMDEGNIFVIATGRSYEDFKRKEEQYAIKYSYVILNHGATVLDNKGNIVYNFPIENSIIDEIKKDVKLEKTIKHFCCSTLESRVDFDHTDLTKIAVTYKTEEEAMRIIQTLNDKYSKYIKAYFIRINSIEIISKETNKSKATSLLMDRLGIDKKNIYTIGDGHSDIEMIKDYNGYCMKDSIEELKKIAKDEFDSVSTLIKQVTGKKDE